MKRSPAKSPFLPWISPLPGETAPIRVEIHSPERLEAFARDLAQGHRLGPNPLLRRALLARVTENGRRLLEAYRALNSAEEPSAVTPAAEWLVDNFHIVDEQLRDIRDHLPPGYYQDLPKLVEGPFRGLPRVFALAWEFLARTDCRFEEEWFSRFIRAYQESKPLSIGEIWALPITLRVVLVENLRRLADRVLESWRERKEADRLADAVLGIAPPGSPETVAQDPGPAGLKDREITRSFAVQLSQRLHDGDPAAQPLLAVLRKRVGERGLSPEDWAREEHGEQAAMNVTVRNVITSMRSISETDWKEAFEALSRADAVLRRNPLYGACDFATRDRYRHALEELAKRAGHSEIEIAEKAVAETADAPEAGDGGERPAPGPVSRAQWLREARLDLGFHLIGKGREAFERKVGFRPPWRNRIRRLVLRKAFPIYLSVFLLLTAVFLAWPVMQSARAGMGAGLLVLLGLLAFFPAGDLALSLLNRMVMALFGPRTLPKIALEEGVPPELRTLVVVPTLLRSPEDARRQAAQLEVHFLSNGEGEVYFALLSDFTDADSATRPEDAAIAEALAAAVAGLNARHGDLRGGPRFRVLHRRRRFNPAENKWMGWERKRGKLEQLNELLRGGEEEDFLSAAEAGDLAEEEVHAVPAGVKYVVTLDADTRLARGSIPRLVGAMAHPLNRPAFDAPLGKVVEGYGLIQPRVTPTIPPREDSTPYHRAFSGPCGIDPYAAAVSDAYQDLFAEGSFTGKGIYDVDAFRAALRGKVPENTLLSHDLFESCLARAGLCTDVEVFEDFPGDYRVEAARSHRWTRGDWQLLPWILGRPPRGPRGRTGPLGALGRFKMLDNLRRSLMPAASAAALVLGWFAAAALDRGNPEGTGFLGEAAGRGAWLAWLWTGFILFTRFAPAALSLLERIVPPHARISKRSHFLGFLDDLKRASLQAVLAFSFLPHQAANLVDAALRALWRVYRSRRRLLEWMSFAQAREAGRAGGSSFTGLMGAPVFAALVFLLLLAFGREALLPAFPVLALWAAAPSLARRSARPETDAEKAPLSAEERRYLRRIARLTWRFFHHFAVERENHLPPDNFQEDPSPKVAHRTSPTNFGLYLLSTASARDFGWIPLEEAVTRMERCLGTMAGLERFRGHFFNWYDTRSLRVLEPRYISTVDSGNLAGHLLALSRACREYRLRPWAWNRFREGLEDSVEVVGFFLSGEEALAGSAAVPAAGKGKDGLVGKDGPAEPALFEARAVHARLAERVKNINEKEESPAGLRPLLEAIRAEAGDLADILSSYLEVHDPGETRLAEALAATEELRHQAEGHLREWALLFPAGAGAESLSLADLAAESPSGAAAALFGRLEALEKTALEMALAMDFRLLYDKKRELFAIGYRPEGDRLDGSFYDLLASEARLASFFAILKGDVPARHWFRLGRSLAPIETGIALVSWSGSMFEYLMPNLVMPCPEGSLLDRTCRMVVQRQIRYGEDRGTPWGVSESAYLARDLELNYQYKNFGVPGLGLKRGLGGEMVVAPYASCLAALFEPAPAAKNLRRLGAMGVLGRYGFHDAVDFTRERLPEEEPFAVIRNYMAHHEGMSLLALANLLQGNEMVERFASDPLVMATELLLQERTPRSVAVARPRAEEARRAFEAREAPPPLYGRYRNPAEAVPRTHFLSNGRYGVMVTTAGTGFSRHRHLAMTRWREDPALDAFGFFLYLRDVATGKAFSAAYQPLASEPDYYSAFFEEERAEYVRRDGDLETRLEVLVSPEDDAELRLLTLKNTGSRDVELDITAYAEIVLAPQAADLAHPAFQNLFVETEFLADPGALLASRRPRSAKEKRVFAALVSGGDGVSPGIQYETDRARFLGRGGTVRNPAAVLSGRPLSGTVGAVLDPVFGLRRRIRVPARGGASLLFALGYAESRGEALAFLDKYRHPSAFERAQTLAFTQAQVQLRHLDIAPDEVHVHQRLLNRLVFADAALRAPASLLQRNRKNASGLWAYGISGDRPLVVAECEDLGDRAFLRQLLRARAYWRSKGFVADLILLNAKADYYTQDLQHSLEGLTGALGGSLEDAGGLLRILKTEILPPEDLVLLFAAARVVLHSRKGTLAQQVLRTQRVKPRLRTAPPPPAEAPAHMPPPRADLEFWNGLGGFADGGREYAIHLGPRQWTPAPWVNVVANEHFGFLVSESGGGYSFSGNSRENKLTSWSNDPVSDAPGECFYVRDLESGALLSPTRLPVGDDGWSFTCRHGFGYSRFSHAARGIGLELDVALGGEDPVKLWNLKVENRTGGRRRLAVAFFAEWVLGVERSQGAPHLRTAIEPETRALLARNPWNAEFADRTAFLDFGNDEGSLTGDRLEFIGRNGCLARPAALESGRERLSGRTGAGFDPCGAVLRVIELGPGESAELRCILGQVDGGPMEGGPRDGEPAEGGPRDGGPMVGGPADGPASPAAVPGKTEPAESVAEEKVRLLVRKYRAADFAEILQATRTRWERRLGSVQVKTPDRALDILLNGWLLYQSLSCRMLARSAFYQSGGAYGFRDQLQDSLAWCALEPARARNQLLISAARQFPEGDVQHWWHPPSGRGVRTRISDDLLFLPYVTDFYIRTTGDRAVLEERRPFLSGMTVPEGREDAYFEPGLASAAEAAAGGPGADAAGEASLYEHCARALDRSLPAGAHGLPLIGSGDWNDGMNRVGHEGKGESVWLGWFLSDTLKRFLPYAEERGETARAARWKERLASLKEALEGEAWDGDWYRRGFFDDGSPLGSAASAECRIDSIAQSWAVISGTGDPERAKRAMEAVEASLVKKSDGLVLLFTPPFNHSPQDPGYIKGYLPGVRENGGQYTHAATWCVFAYALLGDGDMAHEVFSLLNPVHHASTRVGISRYKVEPYVVAADVYAEPPHTGRGGWTWYTGSASWLYRAGTEALLGLRFLEGRFLHLDPCLPRGWRRYEARVRREGCDLQIVVLNPQSRSRGIAHAELDQRPLPLLESASREEGKSLRVELPGDGAAHLLTVLLG